MCAITNKKNTANAFSILKILLNVNSFPSGGSDDNYSYNSHQVLFVLRLELGINNNFFIPNNYKFSLLYTYMYRVYLVYLNFCKWYNKSLVNLVNVFHLFRLKLTRLRLNVCSELNRNNPDFVWFDVQLCYFAFHSMIETIAKCRYLMNTPMLVFAGSVCRLKLE